MEVLDNQLHTKIFCVIPASSSETTCTENLILAKNCCQEHNLDVVCVPENECLKLMPLKECVFVLTEFDSPLFKYLESFECKVVGPQCLLDSLKNGQPIPSTAVFNLAMKGNVVTTTGLTMREKKDIEKKIKFMGGIYTPNLTSSTTHLIAKSVADFGLKFKAATSRAIPIMLPQWIDEVWSARISQEIVHGNDPKYSSYICPVFQGFFVCASQISTKERESIKKMVEANGGKYSPRLLEGETNVLITTSCEGEKYLYATNWKIFCLKPEWVQNSLDQGYVCDPDPFTVKKITTLPPKCSSSETNKLPAANFHNDSVNSTIFNNSTKEIDETHQQCESQSTEPLECLDLALSLKAGPFLKGFKIFPSGFDGPQMEKLRRVLKTSGAIELNGINDESISHVIVGNSVKEDCWKQLQHLDIKPHVVTLQWLTRSLQLKAPAPEAEYFPTDFENLVDPNSKKSFSKETPSELPSVTSVSKDDVRTTLKHSSLSQKTTLMECVTPEACEATTPTDLVIPTPTTVVKISRPFVESLVKNSSTRFFFPDNAFGGPSPHALMGQGPPATPLLLNDLLVTFGISPTPRPAYSNMITPKTPYGRLLNEDPSPDTRKWWKFALDNRVRLTPNTEDSFSASPLQPSESGLTMSMAIDFFQRVHQRTLLDDDSCATIEVANNADASTLPALKFPPLHDVLAFISHDTGSKCDRTELVEIVGTLGGRVCIDHCKEVTHYVCEGELAVSDEMRKAKEWNQIFVRPQWILDCGDSSCRLQEDLKWYIPPLNFETAVSSDVAPVSSSLEIKNDEHQNLPNRPDEEENTLQVEQTVSKQISLSSDAVARKGFEPDAEDLNFLPAPLPNSSFGNLFRVMFSGMDQEECKDYTKIIETLGGIAIDSDVYDATCTHLVVAKLECNAKLMTSIAAGKWIIYPEWLMVSEDGARFGDERKFQWGNPAYKDSNDKEEARIAAAAYYWRTSRVSGLSNGPFQGISAVLYLGQKNDVFQKLLEAGGGKMVAPELALESGEANLCVLDSGEVNNIQFLEYARKGICCVPPSYFRDLILALDEKLQLVDCVLPEFAPLLNLIPSSRI